MLVICALLAAGPLSFLEQPLPGVRVGPVIPYTGQPATNYLRADLDGDGQPELILPDAIYFQRDGHFPEEYRGSWPEAVTAGEADVFGRALYVRTPDGLCIYTREGTNWREALRQPLDWPGARDAAGATAPEHALHFRRFVYDLDGDGDPELLDLSADGLHIFGRTGDRFTPKGVLDVLPAMTLAPATRQTLWPPEARRIVLPEQAMSGRLLVEKGALVLLTRTEMEGGARAYRRTRITLARDESGHFEEADRHETRTGPLPPHVRPCNLRGGGALDFAGGRWLLSETTPVPLPLYETWASLDGGNSFHIERAPSFQHFRPHCSFLDFDGDGDLDLVTESSRLFEGGIRESVNRYLTERTMPHEIRIHAQADGAFGSGQAARFSLEIDLGAPPAAGGAMLERYRDGALVNLTGDFNGDGFRDLAVRSAADRLVVYLARGWTGFDRKPAATFTIPADAEFAVADLNGNGLADIVLERNMLEEEGEVAETTAHLNRGNVP